MDVERHRAVEKQVRSWNKRLLWIGIATATGILLFTAALSVGIVLSSSDAQQILHNQEAGQQFSICVQTVGVFRDDATIDLFAAAVSRNQTQIDDAIKALQMTKKADEICLARFQRRIDSSTTKGG